MKREMMVAGQLKRQQQAEPARQTTFWGTLVHICAKDGQKVRNRTSVARCPNGESRCAGSIAGRKGRRDHEPAAICDSGGGAVLIGRSLGLGRRLVCWPRFGRH